MIREKRSKEEVTQSQKRTQQLFKQLDEKFDKPVQLERLYKQYVEKDIHGDGQLVKIANQKLKLYRNPSADFASLFPKEVETSQRSVFMKCQALSASVYNLLGLIFGERHISEDLQESPSIDIFKQLRNIVIHQRRLTLSYDRYLWSFLQNKKDKWESFLEEANEERQNNQEAFQQLGNVKNKNLQQLHNFLKEIGILASREGELENNLMKKLQKLKDKQYKQSLIKSLTFQTDQENLLKNNPNYKYYDGSTSSKSILRVHKRIFDYEYLERAHDYIQWMFPNHYQSNFNSDSYPLSYLQSDLFRLDKTVGYRLLKSIWIFFNFMGLRLNLHNFSIQLISSERLKNVLIYYQHNHLRIMRILACLSITGFRKIAVQLLLFLDQLTDDREGLFPNVRSTYLKMWAIYNEKHPSKSKSMCFLEYDDFPLDHPILIEVSEYMQNKMEPEQDQKDEVLSNSEQRIWDQRQEHNEIKEQVKILSNQESIEKEKDQSQNIRKDVTGQIGKEKSKLDGQEKREITQKDTTKLIASQQAKIQVAKVDGIEEMVDQKETPQDLQIERTEEIIEEPVKEQISQIVKQKIRDQTQKEEQKDSLN